MDRNTTKKGTSSKKRKNTAQERQAFRFLYVMIAVIILFVTVVCVFVDRKNDKLQAETSTQASTVPSDGTTGESSSVPQTSDATSASGEESTSAETTEAQTVGAAATAPGTIDNPTIITIDEENWYLTLVNTGYRIPNGDAPDLVYVCGSSERLDSKVAVHYEKMYNAAKQDGVNLAPCSGYRSYERQENNYNNKISFYESQGYSTADAKVKAATIIMPPGSSEHNLGYAMDIVCVDEWFEDTAEFKWLTENAADYGFIMRYPKEKQDITGVIYEPWHWRYVGVEAAKEMKASGLVLEEYLGVA